MKKRIILFLLALSVLIGSVPGFTAYAAAVPDQSLEIRGDAYYDAEQSAYVLTEEKTWQGGALWFNQVRCNSNFSIELDFYTGHGEYTNSFGGADGICVAFYSDGSRVGSDGGGLGFEGCGGYGVQIDTYYNSEHNDPRNNHIAIIKDTISNHLCSADATDFTEDGQWHHLKILNRAGVCTVYVDGVQMLRQEEVLPNGQYQIGITASTGSGYNYHAVKNIQLTEAVWSDASGWVWDELDAAQELDLIPETLYDKDMSQPITRAEFAAVAVKVYEKLNGVAAIPAVSNPFSDTSDLEVLKAFNLGVVNGIENNRYDPNALLTREQCATMLTRVFKRVTLPGWTLERDGAFQLNYTMPARFADDAEISDWARESVYFMAANDIINGVGGNRFAPKNITSSQEAAGYANATREQAIAIAVRMVRKLS